MVALLATLASGCTVAPKHPALVEAGLPELVPVRDFVANLDHVSQFRLSPDGHKLAWVGVYGLRSAILWRGLADSDAEAFTFRKDAPRPIWAADSRHILDHGDSTGREQHHVFAGDA